MNIINTRTDLDALRGGPDYGAAMRALLGTTMTWVNHASPGAPPDWQQVSVLTTIQAMGFATQDELLAECTAAGIAAPPPPPMPAAPPSPPPAILSYLQFEALFTAPEQAAIMAAATGNAILLQWLLRAAGAGSIDLGNPETKTGFGMLVGAGLITAARETAILATTAAPAP